ncbi:hypothetical protein ACO2Q3_20555 [Caulobacter sp. KR2-114]|uniref:hypothetical protein n=1 Tax=Caulobacter sp. KR2-114 TaxID=3400912 RepID=UPI003BFE8CE6
MQRPIIAVLTRMKDLDGNTLCFTMPRLTRHRPQAFIQRDAVPDFEGDSATFELLKVRTADSPWPRWTVLRRVD